MVHRVHESRSFHLHEFKTLLSGIRTIDLFLTGDQPVDIRVLLGNERTMSFVPRFYKRDFIHRDGHKQVVYKKSSALKHKYLAANSDQRSICIQLVPPKGGFKHKVSLDIELRPDWLTYDFTGYREYGHSQKNALSELGDVRFYSKIVDEFKGYVCVALVEDNILYSVVTKVSNCRVRSDLNVSDAQAVLDYAMRQPTGMKVLAEPTGKSDLVKQVTQEVLGEKDE